MKRSSQIALVLMGATAVGTTSYALAPRSDCIPPGSTVSGPPTVAPGIPLQAGEPCREPRRWSSGSGFSSWGSRGSTWPRSSKTRTSTASAPSGVSTPSSSRTSTTVARGGFGSTGHSVSSGS